MGYAFISYSSVQQQMMERLRKYLESNGISVWSAPDDIPIGSKYSEVITRAITNASCVLFMLSERSQNSTYCKLEVALALKHSKPIIPIQLEDVILNDEFSLYLCNSEFYPMPGKRNNARTVKLLNQLHILCTDPDKEPVEIADPSYKLGWLRKGTWLQIFGWIWFIGGFIPFRALAHILFPIPPAYDAVGDGLDPFNAPLIATMRFCSGILIAVLLMIGLLMIFYGFSLNRKKRGGERLFFRQFSLCQMMLLLSWLMSAVSIPFVGAELEDHRLGNVLLKMWASASGYIFAAALILVMVTMIVWLYKRIRGLYRARKNKADARHESVRKG